MKNEQRLREAMKRKLEQLRTHSEPATDEAAAARRFGSFLATVCQERGWSADDLAIKLAIEPDLVQALLSGLLPRSEIDDDFLADIGKVIAYDLETLKRILDQDSTTS